MKRATVWSRLGDVARLVATPLVPSHYVALVAPLARPGRARIDQVIDEVPGVKTLVLRPGRGWKAHRPGQHVRVGIAVDGRIVSRMYSISSAAGGATFTITVKAQGRVSNALVTAPRGTFVDIGQPMGDFVCDAGRRSRVLFVTAGSGITPIASMLRSFGDAWPDVVHLHYTRDEQDIIFRDELRALAAAEPRYRRIEVPSAQRFGVGQLDACVPDWRERAAWACGPERLLAAVEAAIEGVRVERFAAALRAAADGDGDGDGNGDENGDGNGDGEADDDAQAHAHAHADAHADADGLGGGPEVGGAKEGHANRARRGVVRYRGAAIVADGRTPLLRVIEDHGLVPRSGCRRGICHSCDVTLAAGCVRDLRTGARISEPGTRIQICVCAAAGDVALEE